MKIAIFRKMFYESFQWNAIDELSMNRRNQLNCKNATTNVHTYPSPIRR